MRKRGVGQCHSAVLFDDTGAGTNETAVGAARAATRLDDFAFGIDRVAGKDGVLDIELHMQKRKAGMLHRRLDQEALGKGVDQRRRCEALLDVRFMREEFEVGEQHLHHASAVDEVGDVGFSDSAPDRFKLSPERQILEAEAEPHCFHIRSSSDECMWPYRHPRESGGPGGRQKPF